MVNERSNNEISRNITNYAMGLRLVNNGIATFDRFDQPVPDKLAQASVLVGLRLNDLDLARHFVRRVSQPIEQFRANHFLATAIGKKGEDPSEYYEATKESINRFPTLAHRAEGWLYLASLEISLGKDPRSIGVSKIIISQLMTQENLTKEADLPYLIRTALDLAVLESTIGRDPTETLRMAKQAIISIPLSASKIKAAADVVKTEKAIGRDPSASLSYTRELANELRIKLQTDRARQKEQKQLVNATLGETIREIITTKKPNKIFNQLMSFIHQEEEEEQAHPLVPKFRAYLYQAEELAETGDNPVPYLDAAKEKVMLGMIRNHQTIRECLEIARTEIGIGLMFMENIFENNPDIKTEDFISTLREAVDTENWEFLAAFGTFLPEELHERYLATVPVEKQNLVATAFRRGLSLKYA